MNFYISDCHFGHKNVLIFDGRPWETVQEMNDAMVEKWNKKVSAKDTVYILGDFIWNTNKDYFNLIKSLNGRKVLVRGNHDRVHSPEFKELFDEITWYKTIKDNGYTVAMSHFFMPLYSGHLYDKHILLYGHSHNTGEHDFEMVLKEDMRKNNIPHESYNVGACHLNYEPCTLDEIMELWNNAK
ncbi:MAG: metallophosphoesterase [Bacilli bacterium]|nr:metallophosphoesterase [Bacilli bacterium]